MFDTIRNLLTNRRSKIQLNVHRVGNLAAYRKHVAAMALEYQRRWKLELSLCETDAEFTTPGLCYACQRQVEFKTDFQYSSTYVDGHLIPNWRERVLCECQLNNRTRASIQILEETLRADKRASIYVAEQVTPLYETLRKRFRNLVGSEYLGESIPFGRCDERSVRNESITKLTFATGSFDFALNFDVLEHIPSPEQGLREIYRVLKPNGSLLLSVPFLPHQQQTLIRARLDSTGAVEHLEQPQYHGDPISSAGCLCFQDFGWDLLDTMRSIGFRKVDMLLYWSAELGYYGVEQMMIVGKK